MGQLIEETRRRERTDRVGDETADVEVDAEVESDETLMMQTTDVDWYRVLHQLRAALKKQTRGAIIQNVRWMRLLHHRCVDTASGKLLGLLRGREADVVALLAAAEVDAGEAEGSSTLPCTTWCAE